MAELFGEERDADGQTVARCPGTGCYRWESSAGDYAEKVLQTRSCDRCNGNAPLENGASGQSSERLEKQFVARIESIVRQQNSGRCFLLSAIEALEWELLQVWRAEELRIERARQVQFKTQFAEIHQRICAQGLT